MKLPRLHFNTAQLLLLTALVALGIALGTAIYQRVRRAARPVATAWSPNGKLAAIRFSDGRIRVWNEAGQGIGTLSTGQFWSLWTTKPTLAVIDEQHLATTNSDGRIEVWNVERGQLVAQFGSTFPSPFWESASISRDGRRVASVHIGAQPGIDIWNVEQGVRLKKVAMFGSPQRLVLSDDGARLAIVDANNYLSMVDIASDNRIVGPVHLQAMSVDRDTVALSGDLSIVAIAAREHAADGNTPVALVDVAKGPQAVVANVPGDIATLALSSDGKTLATASALGHIQLWNTANGKQLGQMSLAVDDGFVSSLDLSQSPAVAMSFSPDAKQLLATTNTSAGVYDVPTLKLNRNLGVIPSRLGRWFFVAAFVVWSVLWGQASRRSIGVLPVRPAVSPDANAIVPQHDTEREDGQARRLPNEGPPRAMIAVWILLIIGGVWAIVWSMLIVFSDFVCLALTPFPYYALFVGVRALAAGSSRARRQFGLPGIALSQVFTLVAGDVVNPPLGVANFVLLRRASVKRYLENSP